MDTTTAQVTPGINMVYILLEPDVRMAFWTGLVVGVCGVFVVYQLVSRLLKLRKVK